MTPPVSCTVLCGPRSTGVLHEIRWEGYLVYAQLAGALHEIYLQEYLTTPTQQVNSKALFGRRIPVPLPGKCTLSDRETDLTCELCDPYLSGVLHDPYLSDVRRDP